MITAIGNDVRFDEIFSYQLDNYCDKGDLLIIFSCSGTSKNIKTLEKFANKKNIEVIKFSGFPTKEKKHSKDFIEYNLNIKNYGICEDIFQSLMHIISQSIRSKHIKNFNFTKKIL